MEEITYLNYNDEKYLPMVQELMKTYLSEPYPVYTYNYFLETWPSLSILAMDKEKMIGAIVSKSSPSRKGGFMKGYIAMLAVEEKYRRLGIGRKLVQMTLDKMREENIVECVLETESSNLAALRLYESFGFIRECRLISYYMNGNDAFRLKLRLMDPPSSQFMVSYLLQQEYNINQLQCQMFYKENII